ncbi:Methionine adenosyltransferase [Thermocrinis albus DSM 14484]|uniref:Methionine adenosyltransferase n=1 Tax=Thermocrinis albus (strain DSM 14484 / JCM 11386 / HI 11/12) TaxID=638303 RepID=D3SPC8_THEAH|nr:methionine adenosyltransferase [Thermocrinis albus]ADC89015.1 Methionine adenosyltransferase [Thermocrinis albus DSM 14484]
MGQIVVSPMTFEPVYQQDVEIVERKGTGHPDTICDLLAEELSRRLCRWYLDKAGFVLHHNVDKALLVGGVAEPVFGGGEVKEPIEIYLVGRAVLQVNGHKLNAQDLVEETVREWLSENIRHLDFNRHVKVEARIRPGSKDLVGIFERYQKEGDVPRANDTSFGVGFAPFDPLEKAVYEAERFLNEHLKEEHPEIGEDIKVMGVRTKDRIRITVALAFVSRYIKNLDDYFQRKEAIQLKLKEYLQNLLGRELEVFINTGDKKEEGNVYITVTGTSAENGDDGQVGRGNRVNGLITPYRPMSLEAAAGKNPISHVGKIYNTVANIISKRVVKEVEGVEEAYCYIVSQIGKPINEPQVVDVKVRTKRDIKGIEDVVQKIVKEELECMPEIWRAFVEGEFSVA